jgi:hypothetical protein
LVQVPAQQQLLRLLLLCTLMPLYTESSRQLGVIMDSVQVEHQLMAINRS